MDMPVGGHRHGRSGSVTTSTCTLGLVSTGGLAEERRAEDPESGSIFWREVIGCGPLETMSLCWTVR